MNCLSRIEIQEFLDKEIEPSLIARISDHIEKCDNCAKLYQQAVEDKAMVDKLLGINSEKNVSIPEFKYQGSRKKRNILYWVVPALVAAAIIGFIFILRFNSKPVNIKIPEAEILMYEFYEGKDLNKLWHEKTQIIILQDEKGNVIQSIITN
jgi:hypothetical protein